MSETTVSQTGVGDTGESQSGASQSGASQIGGSKNEGGKLAGGGKLTGGVGGTHDPGAKPAAPPRTMSELRQQAIDAHQNGDLDRALGLYRMFLANRPEDAAIWSNLGALHRKKKAFPAAVACQRRAVELSPDSSDFLNNLGNALYDNGDLAESLVTRQRVLQLRPGQPEPLQYVATALRGLNRHAEAVAVCNEGLTLDPTHNELRIQKAMALLALGEYATGFDLFEARWSGDEVSKPKLKEPEWQGEPIDGKTLLVMPEQGFGDTVLMARLLPALKERYGARIVLACKAPLMRLFADLDGVDILAEIGTKKPPVDSWVSMMSLPRFVPLTREQIPPPARLSVPEAAKTRAEKLLAPHRGRLKIGVLWSGSVTYRANHKRSFPMDRFYQLAAVPGVSLFSLYKGPLHEAFLGSGLASVVVDAAGSERDFADTAALVQGLDLVVTMDSAVAHVSGSLGAPVWNLLHFSAYWLYAPWPDTSPWYPSMRLVRQPKPDDWDSVFDVVERDIRQMAAARGAG
ncbi:MAG: tetratricopeptide repeat-containing glycosyltransferase family protein [Pseudomonadota bacterium]